MRITVARRRRLRILVLVVAASLGWLTRADALITAVPAAHTWAGDLTGTAGAFTSAIDTATGNATLIVISVDWYGAVANPTLADSSDQVTWALNTWICFTVYFEPSSATIKHQLCYAKNANTSTTHYFRATGSTAAALFVQGFAGADTLAPYDTTTGETGAGVNAGTSTLAPGSRTPSQDDSLVVTGIGSGHTSGTLTVAGWTVTDSTPTVPGQYFGGGLAYLIQTSATAANPTWSCTTTIYAAASIASFKVAPIVSGRSRLTLTGAGK